MLTYWDDHGGNALANEWSINTRGRNLDCRSPLADHNLVGHHIHLAQDNRPQSLRRLESCFKIEKIK